MEKIVDIAFFLRNALYLLILSCAYAAGATGQQLPLFVMSVLLSAAILTETMPGKPHEHALLFPSAVCAILATVVAGFEQTLLAYTITGFVYSIGVVFWLDAELSKWIRVMRVYRG